MVAFALMVVLLFPSNIYLQFLVLIFLLLHFHLLPFWLVFSIFLVCCFSYILLPSSPFLFSFVNPHLSPPFCLPSLLPSSSSTLPFYFSSLLLPTFILLRPSLNLSSCLFTSLTPFAHLTCSPFIFLILSFHPSHRLTMPFLLPASVPFPSPFTLSFLLHTHLTTSPSSFFSSPHPSNHLTLLPPIPSPLIPSSHRPPCALLSTYTYNPLSTSSSFLRPFLPFSPSLFSPPFPFNTHSPLLPAFLPSSLLHSSLHVSPITYLSFPSPPCTILSFSILFCITYLSSDHCSSKFCPFPSRPTDSSL